MPAARARSERPIHVHGGEQGCLFEEDARRPSSSSPPPARRTKAAVAAAAAPSTRRPGRRRWAEGAGRRRGWPPWRGPRSRAPWSRTAGRVCPGPVPLAAGAAGGRRYGLEAAAVHREACGAPARQQEEGHGHQAWRERARPKSARARGSTVGVVRASVLWAGQDSNLRPRGPNEAEADAARKPGSICFARPASGAASARPKRMLPFGQADAAIRPGGCCPASGQHPLRSGGCCPEAEADAAQRPGSIRFGRADAAQHPGSIRRTTLGCRTTLVRTLPIFIYLFILFIFCQK